MAFGRMGALDAPGVAFMHNVGVGKAGSRYAGARFVSVGEDGARDGLYADSEMEGLLATGEMVMFAKADGRCVPASVIGEKAAVELFCHGYAAVEDAIVQDYGDVAEAMKPLLLLLVGGTPGSRGLDFDLAGRLWTLTEHARTGDVNLLDASIPGRKMFAMAVEAERSRNSVDVAGLFDDGRRPTP